MANVITSGTSEKKKYLNQGKSLGGREKHPDNSLFWRGRTLVSKWPDFSDEDLLFLREVSSHLGVGSFEAFGMIFLE